jgi:hypothetical protein
LNDDAISYRKKERERERERVKIKLSLYVIKHYTMKTYGGMEI